ncbi:MAG: DNA topoisomerase III, partial [Caldimonas sp.]
DLLEGFVSNKTRRKFKARLAWDAKEGKVVFAFEPRPVRVPAGKKAGAAGGPSAAKETSGNDGAADRAAAKKAAAGKTPAKKAVLRKAAAKKPAA